MKIERRFIFSNRNPFSRYIKHILRFVDDLFIIWEGEEGLFNDFVGYLNHNDMNMTFTSVFGSDSLGFLDVKIQIIDNEIVTSGFRKPIAKNSILHFNSSHPMSVKKSIPYSQLVRLKRVNNNSDLYHIQANELLDRLAARGYPTDLLVKAKNKIDKIPRYQLLQPKKKEKLDRFVFTFKNTTMNSHIRKVINTKWYMLQQDSDLQESTLKKPIINFRKKGNVSDFIKQQHKKNKIAVSDWLTDSRPIGNFSCGTCSFCKFNAKSKSLKLRSVDVTIRECITCRTCSVVYTIFCSCGRFYVGKTIRPLFHRIREHVRSLVTGVGATRLIQHINSEHNGNVNTVYTRV